MEDMKKITIIHLPKLQPDDYVEQNAIARQLAEKTRELRLHALLVAPEDFASTYEVEAERGVSHTLDRLRNSQANHFVAVESCPEFAIDEHPDVFQELLQARWIGMIVLIEPLESTSSVSAKIDPLPQQTNRTNEALLSGSPVRRTLRYHLNGTFVAPAARRRGIGTALIGAAIQKARKECLKEGGDLCCSVLVDSQNSAAQRLYQKVGFAAVGEESYIQMAHFKDADWKTSERMAVRMEIR